MNGFKGVFLCFFFISCVRVDIKEYVGDALFFVYRSAPLDNSKEVSFWNSPLDYKNEKGDTLSPVSQILLTDMGLDYLVLSIGSHFFSQEMFVESITYEKGGSLVIINMSPLIERDRKSVV